MPMMLGLTVAAEPLAITLFGPEWEKAAPLLSILAFAKISMPLNALNLSALKAIGLSGKLLLIEALEKLGGICIADAGDYLGAHGPAWATVISSFLASVFMSFYIGRLLRYGRLHQTHDFLPSLAISTGIAILAYASLSLLHDLPTSIQLITTCFAGAFAYSFLAWAFRHRN